MYEEKRGKWHKVKVVRNLKVKANYKSMIERKCENIEEKTTITEKFATWKDLGNNRKNEALGQNEE